MLACICLDPGQRNNKKGEKQKKMLNKLQNRFNSLDMSKRKRIVSFS